MVIAGTIICIVPRGGGDVHVNTQTVASKDIGTSTTPAVANKDADDTGTTTLANKDTGTTAVAGQSTDIIDLDISENSMSSVSPLKSPLHLSSPVHLDTDESPMKETSIDPLTLEMEVQNLIDRVSQLEDSHAHMVEMQKSILKNQEKILCRLASLERHDCQYRCSMQVQYPLV